MACFKLKIVDPSPMTASVISVFLNSCITFYIKGRMKNRISNFRVSIKLNSLLLSLKSGRLFVSRLPIVSIAVANPNFGFQTGFLGY